MHDLRSDSFISPARLDGQALIVSVRGDMNLNNTPTLRTTLLDLVQRHRPSRVVLNLDHVPYMDSSAIAVLVELRRRVERMALAGLQPRVRGMLEIVRLDAFFDLVDTEAQALAD